MSPLEPEYFVDEVSGILWVSEKFVNEDNIVVCENTHPVETL